MFEHFFWSHGHRQRVGGSLNIVFSFSANTGNYESLNSRIVTVKREWVGK